VKACGKGNLKAVNGLIHPHVTLFFFLCPQEQNRPQASHIQQMPHERCFCQTKRLGSWISLGKNLLVRYTELNHIGFSSTCSFEQCHVAHSGYGGVVAFFSSQTSDFLTDENCIFLFHFAGRLLKDSMRISLRAIESVVFMTWNRNVDHLLVVLNTGAVRVFDYAGKSVVPSLSLPVPVVCTSCEGGLVALVVTTTEAKLVLIKWNRHSGYSSCELNLPQSIREFAGTVSLIATSEKAKKRQGEEVFLSYSPEPSSSFFCRCVFGQANRAFTELAVPIEGGRVLGMCRSPDARVIAFMMADGSLYSTSSGFSEVSLLTRTDVREGVFKQLTWCGNHCVVVLQRVRFTGSGEEDDESCTALLVNSDEPDNTDSIPDLPYDTCLLLEADGVWALSKDSLYFLQDVSLPVQRVFSVGSRAPAAMLLNTYDEFMTGNASAVHMLQSLERQSGALMDAVSDCVIAAGFEFEPVQQKRLLRIAAFGRTFCSVCDSGAFVRMSKRLRVRNHMRSEPIGMILTDVQLTCLGEEQLLRRLALCNEHQVAFCVADELGYDTKPTMVNWAVSKLTGAATRGKEEEKSAANQVVNKLKACDFNGFAEVAQQAKLAGCGAAALVLLDAETNPGKQVPMLLSIGEADTALRCAMGSADADLLFTVMVHLIRTRGSAVIATLAAHKASRDLLLQYVGMCEGNQDLMVEYFNKNPRIQTLFHLQSFFLEETRLANGLSQLVENTDWEMLQECKSVDIQAAIVSTKKAVEQSPRPQPASTAFSPIVSGGTPFPPSMIEERYLQLQRKLIDEQTQLMKEFRDCRFLQASAADTVRFALEHGRTSTAQRLKNDFSIPEKMFQRCMLSAYLSTGQWDLIDSMSGATSNRKTLLDGEAYVTALLSYKRPQQAKQYISRIPQIEVRMEYYVLCGDWFGAAAECKRNNDPDLLGQLKERAKGNPDVLLQIEEGWKIPAQSTGISFSKFF
jgi:vacuolar protein sorting-associated protein 16